MERDRKGISARVCGGVADFKQALAKCKSWELVLTLVIALTLAAAVWTFLPQGVTQNDEVQYRFDRKIGLVYAFMQNLMVHFEKGRVLSIPTDWRFLGFLFEEMFFNRMICAAMIIGNAVLMGYILYLLRRDKGFSLFYTIAVVLLMPLTFEHAAPAVFTGVITPSMFLIELSVVFYLDARREKPKHRRSELWALLFFVLAMSSYEFMVTYVLLFPALYIYITLRDQKKLTVMSIIQNCWKHILACVFYLVVYFAFAVLWPTAYAGNSMSFISLQSSFEVIKQLFLAAMPGYFYLLNDKYKYIMYLHNGGLLNSNTLFTFRIAVVMAGTLVIAATAVSGKKRKNKLIVSLGGMLTSLAFMILPSTPNSLSSMYQGNVTDVWFTSLPVSYFLHFAAVLLLVQFIWLVLEQVPFLRRLQRVGVVVCFCALVLCQQAFNHVICQYQTESYTRMQFMEECLATDAFAQWDGKTLYSEDMHDVRGILAFHDGYWSSIAALSGTDVNIMQDETQTADGVIQIDTDVMQIWSADNRKLTLLTEKVFQDVYLLLSPDGIPYALNVEQRTGEGAVWVMEFEWDEAGGCFMQVR